MDAIEAASAFLGKAFGNANQIQNSTVPSETHTVTGTATSDSADGLVRVDLEGYTISDDDEQSLELPTTVDVHEGDIVQVTLVGGVGKSPIVTGVVGGGDRLSGNVQEAVDTANAAAEAVAEVADVTHYFFHDAAGAHVTTVEDDATTGPNTLIDSTGMFVRDGTTNLAQFKNPTVIGEVDSGKPNVLIGTDGVDTGVFIRNGTSPKLIMWQESGTGGGYIQSGDGGYLGIYDGCLYFTPFGQSRFTIMNTSKQSGFCIGGYHVYSGTTVQTVAARSYHRVWTNAEFKSTFNVKTESAVGVCYAQFANGDAAAQPKQLNASYKDSSGWFMGVDGTLGAGPFRINYLVVVPDSESTV